MSLEGTNKLANGDSQAYWEAAEQGRLLLQSCRACGRKQFPPRFICHVCWSDKLEWREHDGKGRIYSSTIVHRAPLPDFDTPYVLAMVELDYGPRLMTNIVGPDAFEVEIGSRVEVTFERRGGVAMPMFRRAAS